MTGANVPVVVAAPFSPSFRIIFPLFCRPNFAPNVSFRIIFPHTCRDWGAKNTPKSNDSLSLIHACVSD